MNSRVTAIVNTVLFAVIAGLAAGIVVAQLGASSLLAVGSGGGTFVAVATLGTTIAGFLIPPTPSQGSPASS
ncbi:hypothetical protein ACFTWD_37335 [Streptomyces sp. NPDC056943]|uniref:hypothetical protein n=1 Tax=Streptomyces sp. NPDC056943 TaxID=3345971 RepID=UPI00363EE4C7